MAPTSPDDILNKLEEMGAFVPLEGLIEGADPRQILRAAQLVPELRGRATTEVADAVSQKPELKEALLDIMKDDGTGGMDTGMDQGGGGGDELAVIEKAGLFKDYDPQQVLDAIKSVPELSSMPIERAVEAVRKDFTLKSKVMKILGGAADAAGAEAADIEAADTMMARFKQR